MGNSIILHIETGAEWSPAAWISSEGGGEDADGYATLTRGERWISIVRLDEVMAEYEDDERRFVESLLPDRRSCFIQWRGDEMLAALLAAVPEGVRTLVDNDHGLIAEASVLRARPIGHWIHAKNL